jgi:hypothetical protein
MNFTYDYQTQQATPLPSITQFLTLHEVEIIGNHMKNLSSASKKLS